MFNLKHAMFVITLLTFNSGVIADHVNQQCRMGPRISCVDLTIGLTAFDDAADQMMASFDNFGDLLAALKADENLFAQVNTVLNSSVNITFSTLDSLYDAVNKCGLIPHVIDEIND